MSVWRRWLVGTMGALLVVTMGLLLLGATTYLSPWSEAPWPKTGVFAGYYRQGWETSDFRPAGTKDRWWLEPCAGLQSFPRTCSVSTPCYLVVRGNLSGLGRHGHLGDSNRELEVTETIEQRDLSLYESVAVFKGL